MASQAAAQPAATDAPQQDAQTRNDVKQGSDTALMAAARFSKQMIEQKERELQE